MIMCMRRQSVVFNADRGLFSQTTLFTLAVDHVSGKRIEKWRSGISNTWGMLTVSHRSRGTLEVCVTMDDQNLEQLSSDSENIEAYVL